MSKGRRFFRAARVRRLVQVFFLLAFVGLVLLARPGAEGEAPHAVELFFHLDPLILISTWFSAHAVVHGALLAVALIIVTLLLGRVFCGWVCPLGTIHDIAGRFFDRWRRDPKRHERWSPWQRGKYYLLFAFLVMAAVGSHWVTIFDPLVLLYRTTTTVLLPGVQWAVEDGSTAIYQADPGVGSMRLAKVTDPVYEFLRDNVFVVPSQAFLGAGLIAVFFVAIVALNGVRRRFWCRYLCPLGALLGVFSWRPLLRREVNSETCNQCDLCGMACHGAAASEPGGEWRPEECFGCMNCTESCRRDSLRFRFVWPWRREPAVQRVDLTKRAEMAAAVGGLAAMAFMRSTPQSRGTRFHPLLIRPPGARSEREFLARCTACGLCMKVCPKGALQPSLTEAGLEGLWTPRLVPDIGYCDYECVACGQVCPTGAIEPLTPKAKHEIKIGLASFDTTRCLPYAYGRDCMVCEEHCPVPDKAIYYVEVELPDRTGNMRTIKQPHVDPDLCIGCGVCENVCPLTDRPGIRVTSANETRNPDNQPILPADPWDSPY